jgi:hypothetical protein
MPTPKQQLQIKPLIVSVKQAQAMLGGKGHNQVWQLIASGDLESFGTPRKRWIVVESIEAYVARMRAAASVERTTSALPISKPRPRATANAARQAST